MTTTHIIPDNTPELDEAQAALEQAYQARHQSPPVRIYTNALMELMENGLMNPIKVAEAALLYMSEDDVKEMLQANDMMVFLDAMKAARDV